MDYSDVEDDDADIPMESEVADRLGLQESTLLPVHTVLYSSKGTWSRQQLMRLFGSMTGVLDSSTLSLYTPRLTMSQKGWLIFPVGVQTTYNQRIVINNTLVEDVYTLNGWLMKTTCADDLSFASRGEIRDGLIVFANRLCSEKNGSTVVIVTANATECVNLGYKKMKCSRHTLAHTELIKDFETGANILYDTPVSLFRVLITIPPEVYFDMRDCPIGDIVVILQLLLGATSDWRWATRGLKILVNPLDVDRFNLRGLTPISTGPLYTVPSALYKETVVFELPGVPITFNQNRPVLYKHSDAGAVVHAIGNEMVSFSANVVSRDVSEIIDEPTVTYVPKIFLDDTANSRIVSIVAKMGKMVVWCEKKATPVVLYSSEFITIREKPPGFDMEGASVVTYMGYNVIMLADYSYTTIVQMIHHMLAIEEPRLFWMDVLQNEHRLNIIAEIFMKMVPKNPTAVTLSVNFDARGHMWNPPTSQMGGFLCPDMPPTWSLALRPWTCNMLADGSDMMCTQADIPIDIYHEVTCGDTIGSGTKLIPTGRNLPFGVRVALALKYNCMWSKTELKLFIPLQNTLIKCLGDIVPITLELSEFAFQRPKELALVKESMHYSSRITVIAMSRVDVSSDPQLATVAAVKILKATMGEDAVVATYKSKPCDPLHYEMSLRPIEGGDVETMKVMLNKRHISRGMVTAFYDEALALGWYIGLLGPEDGFSSIYNPSRCLTQFYNAIHPPLPHGVELGSVMIEHDFRSTPLHGVDGLLSYLAATTQITDCGENVIILARNPMAACRNVRFSGDILNKVILDTLLHSDLGMSVMLAKYAQWFGPVIECTSTGDTVSLGCGTPRAVVRITGLHRSYTNKQMCIVTIEGIRYTLVTVGTAPLLMMDNNVCFFDLRANPIAVNTVESNWKVWLPEGGSLTSPVLLSKEYTLTQQCPQQPLPICEIVLARTTECAGTRDITSDPIFINYLQINHDGVCRRSESIDLNTERFSRFSDGEAGRYQTIPPGSQNFTHVATESGSVVECLYKPSPGATKITIIPLGNTGTSEQNTLTSFRWDTLIRLKYISLPQYDWYTGHIMTTHDGSLFIRGTTVVKFTTRPTRGHVPRKYFPGTGALVVLAENPVLISSEVELQPGLFSRSQPPWSGVYTVIDTRLLFGLLVYLMRTQDTIVVNVVMPTMESSVCSMILMIAPAFSEARRVEIVGDHIPHPILPPKINNNNQGSQRVHLRFLGPVDHKHVCLKMEMGGAIANRIMAGNPLVEWVTDDNSSPYIASLRAGNQLLYDRPTATTVTLEPFMLDNLRHFALAMAPVGALGSYNDPRNKSHDFNLPFWFHSRTTSNLALLAMIIPHDGGIYTMSEEDLNRAVQATNIGMIPTEFQPENVSTFKFPAHGWDRTSMEFHWNFLDHDDFILNEMGLSVNDYRTITLENPPDQTLPKRLVKTHSYIGSMGDPTIWWEGCPIHVRFTGVDHSMGICIFQGSGEPVVDKLHDGEVIIRARDDPLTILRTLWYFQGLGGEEPVLSGDGYNQRAILVALRLFMVTYPILTRDTNPPTFKNINIMGSYYLHRTHRESFVETLLKPHQYFGNLQEYTMTERKPSREVLKKTLPLEGDSEALMEFNSNAYFVYELKNFLLASNNILWHSRFIRALSEDPEDKRWVGMVLLAQLPGLADVSVLVAHQNYVHS
nr:hypothetical protein [Salmonid herpesvirus 1]